MVSVRGRASRSAYWWFQLFSFLAMFVGTFVLAFVIFAVNPQANPDLVTALALLSWIPLLIAQVALLGRRLHDTGRSAHFLWLMLIPYLGGFVLFVMSLLPPKDPNPYGQRVVQPAMPVPYGPPGYPAGQAGPWQSPYPTPGADQHSWH